MISDWFPPPLQPFQRLQVTDGLLMNAERWQLAHRYHRQSHSFHYQSLYQSGIVYGLGVRVMVAPTEVRSQYQDGRWLEIQPGMAIDLHGNFIVVTEPISFRLASENFTPTPLPVYLTIRHVDPDSLTRKSVSPLVKETFRIDEKTTAPHANEIELCRLLLPSSGKTVTLQNAPDVFHPQISQPNLLHRVLVRARPHGSLVLGRGEQTPDPDFQGFEDLLASAVYQYPHLNGHLDSTPHRLHPDHPPTCDFLYVRNPSPWSELEIGGLSRHLEAGKLLCVELTQWDDDLSESMVLYGELQRAIAEAEQDPSLTSVRHELATEFQAIQHQILAQLQVSYPVVADLAAQFHTPVQAILSTAHPLRCEPFTFALLPTIEGQPIFMAAGGGIVIILGDLTSAWRRDRIFPLSTATLRETQELGINLLHFAWRRQQLMEWQQHFNVSVPPALIQDAINPLSASLEKITE
jgi:hypothetical protein